MATHSSILAWRIPWMEEPNSVCCDNLGGRDGVVGGREVQEGGDICISMADSC